MFALEGLSASSYWDIIACLLKGKVTFTGVEPGEHTVAIHYQDYEAKQKLNLDKKGVSEYKIKLQIQKKRSLPIVPSLVVFVLTIGATYLITKRLISS